jgi:hypothetical protein
LRQLGELGPPEVADVITGAPPRRSNHQTLIAYGCPIELWGLR